MWVVTQNSATRRPPAEEHDMSEQLRSLNVSNSLNWGKLVKSWATGRNYFDPKKPAPSLPKTLEEFLAQCKAFECGVELGGWVKGISFLTSSEEVLTVRLPPKVLVDRTEAALRLGNGGKEERGDKELPDIPKLQSGEYHLPDFYAEFLRIRPDQRKLKDLNDFHTSRVGDYSVCACQ
jgi:hypothetical protein